MPSRILGSPTKSDLLKRLDQEANAFFTENEGGEVVEYLSEVFRTSVTYMLKRQNHADEEAVEINAEIMQKQMEIHTSLCTYLAKSFDLRSQLHNPLNF